MLNNHNFSFMQQSSVLQRMDPRSKLFITIIMMLLIIAAAAAAEILLSTFIVLIMLLLSRIKIKHYWQGLRPFMLLVLISSLFLIFSSDGKVIFSFYSLNISIDGIKAALIMSLKLILLLLSAQLLIMTTSYLELNDGLERLLQPLSRLGFPSEELVMIMMIAINFIPMLLEEAESIRLAQLNRGADFKSGSLFQRGRMQLAMLVPLFYMVFQRAEELAQAMEARGYTAGQKRSRIKELKMQALDYAAIGMMLSITAVILSLNC